MGTQNGARAQDGTEAQCSTRQRGNATKYVLLALLAVAFLATGGIFVRQSGLAPINTGFYRMLFSIPLLWPLAYGRLHRLSVKQVVLLFVAGLFLAGDVALWNTSFGYTTVANANLLTNLTPFTVIPVAYFLFHERLPRLFLPGAAVTLAGVILLVAAGLIGMARWRRHLFAAMARNGSSAADYFRLPDNCVIELGSRVQL